eukprot:2136900-Pyramimonas_sp.AAC.1
MGSAAMNCAARYCVVNLAVRGVRILTELIWSFSPTCLKAWHWLVAGEARGALDQLELKT